MPVQRTPVAVIGNRYFRKYSGKASTGPHETRNTEISPVKFDMLSTNIFEQLLSLGDDPSNQNKPGQPFNSS